MDNKSKSLDILGIKPVGDALLVVTQGAIDGAGAFLSRICLPAAEEFGLLLKDRVHIFRTTHMTLIAQKAERKLLESRAHPNVEAHPRLVGKILDEGSWIDDDVVQEMWAGLLASSCTTSGVDDSNLIFVNLLSELTTVETRILNFACENAEKYCTPNGLVLARDLKIPSIPLRRSRV